MKKHWLSYLLTGVLALSLVVAAGCGDDGDDDDDDTAAAVDAAAAAVDAAAEATCAEANMVCVTVTVPAEFTGTTVQLMTGFYAALPPMGPPAIIGVAENAPEIGPDAPMRLVHEDITDTGDYFYYVALMMEGGGTMMPLAGVNYVGQTPETVTLDGTALDLGEIELGLME